MFLASSYRHIAFNSSNIYFLLLHSIFFFLFFIVFGVHWSSCLFHPFLFVHVTFSLPNDFRYLPHLFTHLTVFFYHLLDNITSSSNTLLLLRFYCLILFVIVCSFHPLFERITSTLNPNFNSSLSLPYPFRYFSLPVLLVYFIPYLRTSHPPQILIHFHVLITFSPFIYFTSPSLRSAAHFAFHPHLPPSTPSSTSTAIYKN